MPVTNNFSFSLAHLRWAQSAQSELLWSLTVRLSVVRSHFLVYTLASTNINQSTPNLVQLYMAIRSRMSPIMELIGPELFELSALELEDLP